MVGDRQAAEILDVDVSQCAVEFGELLHLIWC